MEAKQYAKYQSYCNGIGITIYPVPYSTSHYKIAVATPNKEKIGEKIFKKFPNLREQNWSDAIRKAYEIIYNKKHNIN